MDRSDPEAALLRRMVARDETALVELYAKIAGTVYACCLRILYDPEEAEDVTSETFWRLWSRASRFDPEHCSALAWILTITRHLALDRRRAVARRGKLLERFRSEPLLPCDQPNDARLEIATALARLSECDRRLLDSAYFGGLSGAEIAARDAIPLGTVKSRMRAALARLRLSFQRGNP